MSKREVVHELGLSWHQFNAVLAKVEFLPGWVPIAMLLSDHPGIYCLVWQFKAKDNDDPSAEETLQYGRKWLVSRYATEDEIVKTAYLAAEVAMKHEIMEAFRYKGEQVFHPHASVNALGKVPLVKRVEGQ
ncbi:MAG TPA: hypothetical protein PKA27_06995 [Fimbriimonadaceae bacterium]|nr:hypothetical protein [Fimbriimonadaceae bacterium]